MKIQTNIIKPNQGSRGYNLNAFYIKATKYWTVPLKNREIMQSSSNIECTRSNLCVILCAITYIALEFNNNGIYVMVVMVQIMIHL